MMNPIGQPFIVLASVESTNIYAMEQFHARLASFGTAFLASHQRAGKGQKNRKWSSSFGENILLSIIIDPGPLIPLEQFYFNAMVAGSCFEFFEKYAGTGTAIKWPNDLYWGDRKAGGILIENIIQGGTWVASITGIGININQTRFDDNLANPVSLKQITGKTYDVEDMARELCEVLDRHFQLLTRGEKEKILKSYNRVLYKRGETVQLRIGNRRLTGRLNRVDPDGKLVVQTGTEESLNFGEVEWLLNRE